MKLTQRNKIIIGIVFSALLIIFLIWLNRKRSSYTVPTQSTTDNTDNVFYTSYLTAQKYFSSNVGSNLIPFSAMSYVGTTVSVTTMYPHGLSTGDTVIVGGVLGTQTGLNSPVTIGTSITNSAISTLANQDIQVTTSTAHGLAVGSLINIQGTGTYDTQANCNLAGNQGGTTPQCPARTFTDYTGGTSTIYPSAGPTVSAVKVNTVPTTTQFTYTPHGTTATANDPNNIPASASPTNSNGITVPLSGIPSPFTVAVSSPQQFTYTSSGLTGTGTVASTNLGWAYKAGNNYVSSKYFTKDKAILDAVNQWITTKCPYLGTTDITDNGYKTNVSAINTAYSTLVNSYNTTGSPDINSINAARKADLTTALRAYLSTACPGVYAGPAVDIGNSTNGYGQNLTFGSSGTGVDTSVITSDNVTKWARYAALDPTVSSSSATTPLVASSTSWTNNVTEPITGTTMQAWQVAKNFGPGTVYGNGLAHSSGLFST
jgi:hypothetical protein